MRMIEHTLDLQGSGCFGKYARPELIGPVLSQIKPTIRETVRMGILHSSRRTGRPFRELSAAWDIRSGGQTEGPDDSTRIYFRAPLLRDAAPTLFEQGVLWETGPKEDDTAFDLLGGVLRDVSANARESERYDADLLRRLAKFDRPLKSGLDRIRLGGHKLDTLSAPAIDQNLTKAAKSLIAETPRPKRARVIGTLDMIRVSDRVFELVLAEGERVRAVWTEPSVVHLARFLNRRVLIEGQAVFRASGNLLRIDTSAITDDVGESDSFFSKLPAATAGSRLADRVRQPQRPGVGALAVYGRWPGDETEDELLAALQELRR